MTTPFTVSPGQPSPLVGETGFGRASVVPEAACGHDVSMTYRRRYFAVLWSAQTWREIAYLLLGLPLGALWFTYAVTMYVTSVSLVIVWVGIPLLILTHWSMRAVGVFERLTFNSMLGEIVAAPRRTRFAAGDGKWSATRRWLQELLHDSGIWRVVAWVSARGVFGGVGFAVALLGAVMPIALLAAALQAILYQFGIPGGIQVDPNDAGALRAADVVTFWTAVASPVLLLAAPLFAWASRGTAYIHRVFARWALGPGEDEAVEAANERANLAEEQLRIDQELHDSIGHMITMNIIQAGAGAHVFESDPEFARQALSNIEERGRAAMGELDRIIAAIRGDQPETRAPLAGVGDLGRLVEESRAAGMTIVAHIDAPQVPAAVGRAAFMIVREALTNVARHAPGAPVRVRVEQDGDALALEVVNEVPAAMRVSSARGNRRGLSGIRDRAALLGGRSHVGPEEGAFAVRALLPLETTLAAQTPDPTSPWAALRERV